MPQTPSGFSFEGQSLKGMELDVKLQSNGNENYASVFAATAFDVQVAAATTSRQFTLNKESRSSAGAAGDITATCDVFLVPDSPGQFTVNYAFRTGEKINVRRSLFGQQIATADLSTSGSIEIATAPTASAKGVPTSGGVITFTPSGADAADLTALRDAARMGMTLRLGTNYYFIDYEDSDGTLYAAASPDDNDASTPATEQTNFPYIGSTAVAAVSTGNLFLYSGRSRQTLYTGTVTSPIVPTDAAPGDDGNDLSTTQFSMLLDDIGSGEGFGTGSNPLA